MFACLFHPNQHSGQWLVYKCARKPPPSRTRPSLPEIVEMSSTTVDITWVCESGFLQGARKWTKTSELIVFCHRAPFKCSSPTFPIGMKVRWLTESPNWMRKRCVKCSFPVDLPSHKPHLLRLVPCLLCFAFLLCFYSSFFMAVVCESYRVGGLWLTSFTQVNDGFYYHNGLWKTTWAE